MSIRFRTLTFLLFFCFLLPGTQAADRGYAVYQSDSTFEDVLDGLKAAILERGMYINNVMDMGEMLARTGKDLGMEDRIYGQARTVEFCSAVLSREMTLEDPARIVNCPFIVSVYTLPDKTGITFVAHREVPEDQIAASTVMARVAAMLKEVSAAAVEW